MRSIPLTALAIGLFVQTVVTMAAYSIPAAAPAIAADLGIAGERAGIFISIVYGVGMISAILTSGFIHRYGAVRVSQFILISGIAMLTMAALGGSLAALAGAAVLLGIGYGATAPTSTHLLMKRTPQSIRNLVFSIRQIGVPLGGVLGGLIVPPLVLAFDWETALALQILPMIALFILLQLVRSTYDQDRQPNYRIRTGDLFQPLILLRKIPELRALSLSVFFYAGIQLCFVAFIVVHLTSNVGFSLVAAGQMLAIYQLAGVISRPIWGSIADKWIPADIMLSAMGLVIAAMALLAGQFDETWSWISIMLVTTVAGATASGYTGIAFAEFARIGGNEHAAAATGLGASTQFFGVMLLPSIFSIAVSIDGYATAYIGIAILALISGGILCVARLRRTG